MFLHKRLSGKKETNQLNAQLQFGPHESHLIVLECPIRLRPFVPPSVSSTSPWKVPGASEISYTKLIPAFRQVPKKVFGSNSAEDWAQPMYRESSVTENKCYDFIIVITSYS